MLGVSLWCKLLLCDGTIIIPNFCEFMQLLVSRCRYLYLLYFLVNKMSKIWRFVQKIIQQNCRRKLCKVGQFMTHHLWSVKLNSKVSERLSFPGRLLSAMSFRAAELSVVEQWWPGVTSSRRPTVLSGRKCRVVTKQGIKTTKTLILALLCTTSLWECWMKRLRMEKKY